MACASVSAAWDFSVNLFRSIKFSTIGDLIWMRLAQFTNRLFQCNSGRSNLGSARPSAHQFLAYPAPFLLVCSAEKNRRIGKRVGVWVRVARSSIVLVLELVLVLDF